MQTSTPTASPYAQAPRLGVATMPSLDEAYDGAVERRGPERPFAKAVND